MDSFSNHTPSAAAPPRDDPFDSATRGLREAGASADERDLVEWITRHGREEGVLLERYERLAHESTSAATRYLVRLIIEDERRHHQTLAEIAEAIAWGTLTSPVPALPRSGIGDVDNDAELVAQTKALLASEKRDRTELRRLRRRLRSYTGTLWPLLVDLMLLDTEKHTRILEYVTGRTSP
ncbi:MAG TPA: hypothetical protein VMV22_12940 [Acidimicrobiales bacterium]|nr:hypothetical protein [Acidimicrobiales bacterium]